MKKLLTLSMVLLFLPAGAFGQETSCDGNFHIVHRTTEEGRLNDIAFTPEGQGWAVGFDYEPEPTTRGPQERPWIVRFDADSYESMIPEFEHGTQLSAVEAFASDDIYAVGYRYMRGLRSDPVVYHWDGIGWTQMQTPAPGDRTELRDVTVVSPSDVWAVGWFSREGVYASHSLVLHYDGTTWSRVAAPSPGRFTTLTDIDSHPSGRLQVVGGKGWRGTQRGLFLRWEGDTWVGAGLRTDGQLEGLEIVGPNELFASGRFFIFHRKDGFTYIPETPDPRGSELYVDMAVEGDNAWAVGQRFVQTPYEATIPHAIYSTPLRWKRTEFEGSNYGEIAAVALDPTGAAWAVGQTFDPEGPDVGHVIERACL